MVAWFLRAGADRLLAMDLHSGQCVGYFDIPVDHVYGDSVLLDYLASKRISTGAQELDFTAMVIPRGSFPMAASNYRATPQAIHR